MRRWIVKRYYRRKFQKAYKTFQSLYERHKDAGHEIYFNAVNESDFHLTCHGCPELQPLRRKEKDKVVVYRDRFGRILPPSSR